MVVLPLVSLLLLSIYFLNTYGCWRQAILSSAIVIAVFITATTEILSLFHWLSFIPVSLVWLIFNLVLLLIVVQKKYYLKPIRLFQKSTYSSSEDFSIFLVCLLSGIIAIAVLVGVIAIIAPPNTWDSMTYHMSRVVHWVQNRSVAHYPTYNLPQLFHPPFAEFAITHLQILSQSDRYANLIQWFSAIGSALGVSLIAQQFNANKRGQVFAAVFAATIPMGILQASSTQNDYVVTFWLVCLAYQVLLTIKTESNANIFWFIGASLGLGILTKSSAYLYSFPFMVWFSLVQLKQGRWAWSRWQSIGLTTAIAILLNLGHYWRNCDLFNSFLGTPKNFAAAYKIEVISLPTFISNILRNMGLHLDIVRNLGLQNWITPITGLANKLLLIFHNLIGIDMYDPRTTAASYGGVKGLSFDENVAGNPLHFFILLAVISYCFIQSKLRRDRFILSYNFATISCFLLLCLTLKIQGYQSRHHLAIFVLFAPLVGVVLSKIPLQKIANTLAIGLIIASLPWVLNNKFRPLAAEANIFNVSRIEQYFINRPYLQAPYLEVAKFIESTQCQNIGLSLGDGTSVGNEYWEYPLWVLLKNNQSRMRLENIAAENISLSKTQTYPYKNFTPCAIIAIRNQKDTPITTMTYQNTVFVQSLSAPPLQVLSKK
jgi:Dolichyl-phosphate-mannose-protein mannosyltransferase